MNSYSTIFFFVSIILMVVILKQYLMMWTLLENKNLKLFKYLLPICEIILLILFDEVFLLPSVFMFLILIYKYKIYDDIIFNKYYRIDKHKFNFKARQIILVFIFSPIIFLICSFLAGKLSILFDNSDFNYTIYSESNDIFLHKQLVDYIVIFTVTCIIAPVVEEFTYRVLIYRSWLSSEIGKRIYAVLISSCIFAFSHFNIATVGYTFLVGIFLCFIYDAFGYLSSVVLHMLLNTYAFIGALGTTINEKYIALAITVSLVLLCGLILIDKKYDTKRKVKL